MECPFTTTKGYATNTPSWVGPSGKAMGLYVAVSGHYGSIKR